MTKKFLGLVLFLVLTIPLVHAEGKNKLPKHKKPHLTSEQQTCMDSKVGPKGKGNSPSKEALDAAFAACGIDHKAQPAPPELRNQPPGQGDDTADMEKSSKQNSEQKSKSK